MSKYMNSCVAVIIIKIHFDNKVKLESKHKIKYRRNSHMLRSETATECWNVRKYEIKIYMSIAEQFVTLKNMENVVRRI